MIFLNYDYPKFFVKAFYVRVIKIYKLSFSLTLFKTGRFFAQSNTTLSGSFSLSQTNPYFFRASSLSCFFNNSINSSLEKLDGQYIYNKALCRKMRG